jgi:hypothetical protein
MMAEEFEGPVIVKRPAGQPPNFEVAKFDGDVGLDGTVKTTHVSAGGNISAQNNVNAKNMNVRETVTTQHVHADGNISAQNNANAKNMNVAETVNTQHVHAVGNISAVNPGTPLGAPGGNINAENNVNAKNMNVREMVTTQHVHADGNISAQNNVNAKNINVKEDIILANSDCAEEFDLEDSSTGEPLPGCVMVIGDEGSVRLSTSAYDKRVAGVISGAGAFKPGIILDRRTSDSRRPAVALMGRVFCKADTTNGPIEVGDLLTTSGTPGHAMKATDSSRAFGAVIGKALRRLREGKDLIPILIALQ